MDIDNGVAQDTLYTAEQAKALALFLRQQKPAEIAGYLGIATRTVQRWIAQFNWKALRDDTPVGLMLKQRIAYLMWVDHKLESQERELKMLLDQQLKREEAEQRRQRPTKNNDTTKPRGRKPNRVKNDVSHITKAMLDEYREKTFFDYQKAIHSHKHNDEINETRFYLKSRQIGLTFYFAFEAFEDAVLTGDSQVFISASKKQSYIFKNYIRQFALEIGEVDLKGKDDIALSNGANLGFMSTNVATSQGFHGHMYWDEVFWIPHFAELDDYAGAMALQAQYRTTYISTPSTMAHDAYPKWRGKKEHDIDISHQALKEGALGVDFIFRQMITVDDAIKKGATFFNMAKLKRKYPVKEIFDNLLRCKFLDDSASFFSLKALLACKTDSSLWKDVDHSKARPVGSAEVLVGYDPRGGGQGDNSDDAGLVVALKPKRKGGIFRFIERLRLKGSSYEQQAETIRGITEKYHVVYMAMDTSGVGSATAELVRKFYPALIELDYSPEVKRLMAYKSREIINSGRLQFEAEWDDLVHSFLMIRQQTTKVSNQITFVSNRSKIGSHADLAWASMHVLRWEPIDINNDTDSTVEFF